MKLPQLSLRDLFLLVALVAMGCGWWVHRSKLIADHQRDIADSALLIQGMTAEIQYIRAEFRKQTGKETSWGPSWTSFKK
jgi:hypothetical protein